MGGPLSAHRSKTPVLWVGVVELKPLSRAADGAAGAFTNILTWACNVEGFQSKADTIAATLDMYVVGVDVAEFLCETRQRRTLTEEFEEMVLRAESNPNAIIYSTSHTYPFDTA